MRRLLTFSNRELGRKILLLPLCFEFHSWCRNKALKSDKENQKQVEMKKINLFSPILNFWPKKLIISSTQQIRSLYVIVRWNLAGLDSNPSLEIQIGSILWCLRHFFQSQKFYLIGHYVNMKFCEIINCIKFWRDTVILAKFKKCRKKFLTNVNFSILNPLSANQACSNARCQH